MLINIYRTVRYFVTTSLFLLAFHGLPVLTYVRYFVIVSLFLLAFHGNAVANMALYVIL